MQWGFGNGLVVLKFELSLWRYQFYFLISVDIDIFVRFVARFSLQSLGQRTKTTRVDFPYIYIYHYRLLFPLYIYMCIYIYIIFHYIYYKSTGCQSTEEQWWHCCRSAVPWSPQNRTLTTRITRKTSGADGAWPGLGRQHPHRSIYGNSTT
jgi:hypothetical protein